MKLGSVFMVAALSLLTACGRTASPEPVTVVPQALPSPTEPSPPPTQKSVSAEDDRPPVVTPETEVADSPLATPPADGQSSLIATPRTNSTRTPVTPSPDSEAMVAKAKEMLNQLPGLETNEDIVLVNVETRQWRDSSLGCPREGMMYNQVITPGYLIVLQADGKQFEFHTDTTEMVVLCFIDGEDALEVLQN